MELGRKPNDPSAGYMEEDSELEFSDGAEPSSDEDVQCQREQDNLSSDEFEKDMESKAKEALREVLGTSLADLVNGGALKPNSVKPVQPTQAAVAEATAPGPSTDTDKPEVEYYDDIYFDSESEEEETKGSDNGGEREKKKKKTKKKVRKLTNDELFYDPDMDDDDERWVARQRMAYHNVKVAQELVQDKGVVGAQKRTVQPRTAAMPTSDAVLNCPACMSTLCIDCQRHELYPQQYRAMFVMNCKILKGEVLKFAPKQDKRALKRKRGKEEEREGGSNAAHLETYHPVHCSVCDTEVAVYDQDEVYHFFSVLASVP